MHPGYEEALQEAIPKVMADNAIPGVVVLIRSQEQGDWSATFGTAEIGKEVPMSITDYFRIGSNTKTMTSTVILQLVQEGKLALDDPIGKYRPDVPNGENITIQQLAEMRSGLFSYTFDKGFNETLDKDPQKAWTPDELLKIAFTHPPNSAPGVMYDYSNTNIVLLGVVIEQLTGMSASEAFEERLFQPLGLTHTSLPLPTTRRSPTRTRAVPVRHERRDDRLLCRAGSGPLEGTGRHAEADRHNRRQPIVGMDRRRGDLDAR